MPRALTPEVKSEIKELFALFDHNHTGLLDAKALETVLRSLGLNPSAIFLQGVLLHHAASGGVSLETVEALYADDSQLLPTASDDASLEEAFSILDEDGTGFISRKELEQSLLTDGDTMSPEEVHRVFRVHDATHTGDQLSLSDFKALMRIGSNSTTNGPTGRRRLSLGGGGEGQPPRWTAPRWPDAPPDRAANQWGIPAFQPTDRKTFPVETLSELEAAPPSTHNKSVLEDLSAFINDDCFYVFPTPQKSPPGEGPVTFQKQAVAIRDLLIQPRPASSELTYLDLLRPIHVFPAQGEVATEDDLRHLADAATLVSDDKQDVVYAVKYLTIGQLVLPQAKPTSAWLDLMQLLLPQVAEPNRGSADIPTEEVMSLISRLQPCDVFFTEFVTGRTALAAAVAAGCETRVIQALIDGRSLITHHRKSSISPLHIACATSTPDVLMALLTASTQPVRDMLLPPTGSAYCGLELIVARRGNSTSALLQQLPDFFLNFLSTSPSPSVAGDLDQLLAMCQRLSIGPTDEVLAVVWARLQSSGLLPKQPTVLGTLISLMVAVPPKHRTSRYVDTFKAVVSAMPLMDLSRYRTWQGGTALHVAVAANNLPAVKTLLEVYPSLALQLSSGVPHPALPLVTALRRRPSIKTEIVDMLKAATLPQLTVDIAGGSPKFSLTELFYAALHAWDQQVLGVLAPALSTGAEKMAKNENKKVPAGMGAFFQWALAVDGTANGSTNTVGDLLVALLPSNAQTFLGDDISSHVPSYPVELMGTPLHVLAGMPTNRRYHTEETRYLVSVAKRTGGLPLGVDWQGNNVLHIAVSANHEELVGLLLDALNSNLGSRLVSHANKKHHLPLATALSRKSLRGFVASQTSSLVQFTLNELQCCDGTALAELLRITAAADSWLDAEVRSAILDTGLQSLSVAKFDGDEDRHLLHQLALSLAAHAPLSNAKRFFNDFPKLIAFGSLSSSPLSVAITHRNFEVALSLAEELQAENLLVRMYCDERPNEKPYPKCCTGVPKEPGINYWAWPISALLRLEDDDEGTQIQTESEHLGRLRKLLVDHFITAISSQREEGIGKNMKLSEFDNFFTASPRHLHLVKYLPKPELFSQKPPSARSSTGLIQQVWLAWINIMMRLAGKDADRLFANERKRLETILFDTIAACMPDPVAAGVNSFCTIDDAIRVLSEMSSPMPVMSFIELLKMVRILKPHPGIGQSGPLVVAPSVLPFFDHAKTVAPMEEVRIKLPQRYWITQAPSFLDAVAMMQLAPEYLGVGAVPSDEEFAGPDGKAVLAAWYELCLERQEKGQGSALELLTLPCSRSKSHVAAALVQWILVEAAGEDRPRGIPENSFVPLAVRGANNAPHFAASDTDVLAHSMMISYRRAPRSGWISRMVLSPAASVAMITAAVSLNLEKLLEPAHVAASASGRADVLSSLATLASESSVPMHVSPLSSAAIECVHNFRDASGGKVRLHNFVPLLKASHTSTNSNDEVMCPSLLVALLTPAVSVEAYELLLHQPHHHLATGADVDFVAISTALKFFGHLGMQRATLDTTPVRLTVPLAYPQRKDDHALIAAKLNALLTDNERLDRLVGAKNNLFRFCIRGRQWEAVSRLLQLAESREISGGSSFQLNLASQEALILAEAPLSVIDAVLSVSQRYRENNSSSILALSATSTCCIRLLAHACRDADQFHRERIADLVSSVVHYMRAYAGEGEWKSIMIDVLCFLATTVAGSNGCDGDVDVFHLWLVATEASSTLQAVDFSQNPERERIIRSLAAGGKIDLLCSIHVELPDVQKMFMTILATGNDSSALQLLHQHPLNTTSDIEIALLKAPSTDEEKRFVSDVFEFACHCRTAALYEYLLNFQGGAVTSDAVLRIATEALERDLPYHRSLELWRVHHAAATQRLKARAVSLIPREAAALDMRAEVSFSHVLQICQLRFELQMTDDDLNFSRLTEAAFAGWMRTEGLEAATADSELMTAITQLIRMGSSKVIKAVLFALKGENGSGSVDAATQIFTTALNQDGSPGEHVSGKALCCILETISKERKPSDFKAVLSKIRSFKNPETNGSSGDDDLASLASAIVERADGMNDTAFFSWLHGYSAPVCWEDRFESFQPSHDPLAVFKNCDKGIAGVAPRCSQAVYKLISHQVSPDDNVTAEDAVEALLHALHDSGSGTLRGPINCLGLYNSRSNISVDSSVASTLTYRQLASLQLPMELTQHAELLASMESFPFSDALLSAYRKKIFGSSSIRLTINEGEENCDVDDVPVGGLFLREPSNGNITISLSGIETSSGGEGRLLHVCIPSETFNLPDELQAVAKATSDLFGAVDSLLHAMVLYGKRQKMMTAGFFGCTPTKLCRPKQVARLRKFSDSVNFDDVFFSVDNIRAFHLRMDATLSEETDPMRLQLYQRVYMPHVDWLEEYDPEEDINCFDDEKGLAQLAKALATAPSNKLKIELLMTIIRRGHHHKPSAYTKMLECITSLPPDSMFDNSRNFDWKPRMLVTLAAGRNDTAFFTWIDGPTAPQCWKQVKRDAEAEDPMYAAPQSGISDESKFKSILPRFTPSATALFTSLNTTTGDREVKKDEMEMPADSLVTEAKHLLGNSASGRVFSAMCTAGSSLHQGVSIPVQQLACLQLPPLFDVHAQLLEGIPAGDFQNEVVGRYKSQVIGGIAFDYAPPHAAAPVMTILTRNEGSPMVTITLGSANEVESREDGAFVAVGGSVLLESSAAEYFAAIEELLFAIVRKKGVGDSDVLAALDMSSLETVTQSLVTVK